MPIYEDTNYYRDARFTLFGKISHAPVTEMNIEHYETNMILENGNGGLTHAHESIDYNVY